MKKDLYAEIRSEAKARGVLKTVPILRKRWYCIPSGAGTGLGNGCILMDGYKVYSNMLQSS